MAQQLISEGSYCDKKSQARNPPDVPSHFPLKKVPWDPRALPPDFFSGGKALGSQGNPRIDDTDRSSKPTPQQFAV